MKRFRFLASGLSMACAATLLSWGTAALAQTTTLGTRNSLSQPNASLAPTAQQRWTAYSRTENHPNAVSLPLEFITLKSGKKMAVRVSVPADWLGRPVKGKFPAILTQTAYRIDVGQILGNVATKDTTLLIGGLDKFMIQRGYISVAVDVWGTGMTGGVTALIGEEEQAAYQEALDWVTRQPWYNGKVGLAGTSYLGITSLLTASKGHPAVQAVFAEVPMGDPFRGTVGTGGLLNPLFLGKWLTLTQALSVQNGPAALLHPWYASTINAATKDHEAAIDRFYNPTWDAGTQGQVGIATDDGTFWSVRSPLEVAAQIKAPTFIVGSNLDIFQRDEPLLYEQLKNRVDTKLLIVPGAHLQAVLNAQKDTTAQGGAPGSSALLLQWFDQYLKGIDTGVKAMPRVTQFVDGYGTDNTPRFATAADWPHPQMSPQRWYLRADHRLSTQAPQGMEANHAIPEPAAPKVSRSRLGNLWSGKVEINDGSDCSSSYVQWTLGMASLLGGKPCYTDSRTVEATQQAVVYETEPLAQDLYLNGPIQADVWMSATRSQAALSVRVDVVDATGKARTITHGLMSAAYRAVDASRSRQVQGVMMQPWHPFTAASSQPLQAGQPVLVPVEVFPTAALVKAGQKLRVAISASNQAQGVWTLDRQPLADGNVSTIYSDVLRPSSIVLPVVPRSVLN